MDSDLFVKLLIIHLLADWIFQNHWMAINKANLKHPAGYVHAGIHTVFLLVALNPAYALLVGITHLLIDTRKPVQWWQQFYKQTTEGVYAVHVSVWVDQVFHIMVLALVSLII